MRVFCKIFLTLVCILALAGSYSAHAQPILGGQAALGGTDPPPPEGLNFDPPSYFSHTSSLDLYMNGNYGVFFIGGGAVLNSASNFLIPEFDPFSGGTPTNFVAWNALATNLDGSSAALPEIIFFLDPVSEVSMRVGTGLGSGMAVLVAFNDDGDIIDSDDITVDSSMQDLTVSATDPATGLPAEDIIAVVLLGDSGTLVMDDFIYQPFPLP